MSVLTAPPLLPLPPFLPPLLPSLPLSRKPTQSSGGVRARFGHIYCMERKKGAQDLSPLAVTKKEKEKEKNKRPYHLHSAVKWSSILGTARQLIFPIASPPSTHNVNQFWVLGSGFLLQSFRMIIRHCSFPIKQRAAAVLSFFFFSFFFFFFKFFIFFFCFFSGFLLCRGTLCQVQSEHCVEKRKTKYILNNTQRERERDRERRCIPLRTSQHRMHLVGFCRYKKPFLPHSHLSNHSWVILQ